MKKKKNNNIKMTFNTEMLIGQDVRDILDEKGGQVEKTKEELKAEAKRKRRRTRPFYVISYSFVLLFVALIGYMVYFNIQLKDDILSSPYNKRQDNQAEYVIRGNIESEDRVVLATTQVDPEGNETRVYPQGRVYAHAVGYAVRGKSGLESEENYTLLSAHNNTFDHVINDLLNEKNPGDTVVMTIDNTLQQTAYNALGDYRGGVIAIDPKTSEIKVWVSKPDFDPNTLDADWEALVSDSSNSNLVNRVSQGRYTPGSIFKIVTALAYYQKHGTFSDFFYNCTGEVTFNDQTVHCFDGEVHGQLNMEQAFANSCNCAFVTMGMDVGPALLKKTAESLLFNANVSSSLAYNASSFKLDSSSTTMDIMQTSFGQGKTTVSPYHMALIVSAIANKGVVMKPSLVSKVVNAEDEVISKISPQEYTRLMTEEEADALKSLMSAVVSYGTGTSLSGRGYEAAGKTGTADINNADGSAGTNSWFVGILNPSDPELVVAVVAENGGSGSATALPVCAAIFDAYHSQIAGG